MNEKLKAFDAAIEACKAAMGVCDNLVSIQVIRGYSKDEPCPGVYPDRQGPGRVAAGRGAREVGILLPPGKRNRRHPRVHVQQL